MAFLDLTWRDAERILDGSRPPRGDDSDLAHELAFMRATRDVEPAPPMSVDLICLIDGATQSCPN